MADKHGHARTRGHRRTRGRNQEHAENRGTWTRGHSHGYSNTWTHGHEGSSTYTAMGHSQRGPEPEPTRMHMASARPLRTIFAWKGLEAITLVRREPKHQNTDADIVAPKNHFLISSQNVSKITTHKTILDKILRNS